MKFKLTTISLAVLALSACGYKESPSASTKTDPTYAEILVEAQKHEHVFEDGWYFGELPRMFKSAYSSTSPADKAKFAMELEGFLRQRGQDMSANSASYVPYSQRAGFAESWWSKSDRAKEFGSQTKKMKVVWIQESLMDGSELWWRAYENVNRSSIDYMQALAHDEEQKRVHEYQNEDGKPRSLSDLVY